jgi:hypothetical protein
VSLSTAQLILQWDARRPRSLQETLGMSDLGGCRRRAKYRLEGTEPTDEGGSIQAALGTLIHEGIAQVVQELREAGLIPAGYLVEAPVEFGGVEGHLDRYESDTLTVIDSKSTNSHRMRRLRETGELPKSWRYQTVSYAGGLVKQGREVRWIRIEAICRDTGEEWTDTRPFDVDELREAKAWLDDVRATPLEQTERDYEPGSAWCERCPFRRACWGDSEPDRDSWRVLFAEDPDARKWADELRYARAAKADAKLREDRARGALLGAAPEGTARKRFLDVGWPDKVITFTESSSTRIDGDAVKELCTAAGIPVPTKDSPSTTVGIGNRPKDMPAA